MIDERMANPHYRSTIEELFVEDAAWIVTAREPTDPSKWSVWAYADHRYGYIAFTTNVDDADIQRLHQMCLDKGFKQRRGEYDGFYALPGARWWNEGDE